MENLSSALPQHAPGYVTASRQRFLVISDLHGANRFGFVRALLEHEARADRPIRAVLILGDLVNFGYTLELHLAGFGRSLGLLQVPVLVILGNHDKHGTSDTSVRRSLSRIPNVHLLEHSGGFHVHRFGDVTIGGFDDPRFFGDDNTDNALKQQPARDRFLGAMADRGVPDVVMVHEPYAAGTGNALWLNGHMHSPSIDVQRKRVQVGMFTDGSVLYNRAAHRRTVSNFVLLGADPTSWEIASVVFTWDRRSARLGTVETARIMRG